MAFIPPLHSYLIWTLAGMVMAHGLHPTIEFVFDMDLGWDGACSEPSSHHCIRIRYGARARPRQGVSYHAHTFSHNRYGPGTKAQCPRRCGSPRPRLSSSLGLGPGPMSIMAEHMCMINDALSWPCQGCHSGHKGIGGKRAMSKYHPSQGPYQKRMQCNDEMTQPVTCARV